MSAHCEGRALVMASRRGASRRLLLSSAMRHRESPSWVTGATRTGDWLMLDVRRTMADAGAGVAWSRAAWQQSSVPPSDHACAMVAPCGAQTRAAAGWREREKESGCHRWVGGDRGGREKRSTPFISSCCTCQPEGMESCFYHRHVIRLLVFGWKCFSLACTGVFRIDAHPFSTQLAPN